MKLKSDKAELGKKCVTARRKAGDDDLVVCTVKLAIPVDRDQFDELAGWPVGVSRNYYDEQGAPYAHMSLLLTKRELLVKGRIARHVPKEDAADGDDDGETATLSFVKALGTSLRFVLAPLGATFICELTWKAKGTEVDDVRDLLGSKVEISLDFSDPQLALVKQGGNVQPEVKRLVPVPPQVGDLATPPGAVPVGAKAKGKRAAKNAGKATGKDAAAGEKEAPTAAPAKTRFERDAEERARRSPRKVH